MSALHTVTVTVDDEGNRDEVIFTCAAAPDADCRVYPDAQEWDEEERVRDGVQHEQCWIAGWFQGEGYDFIGEGAIPDGGPASVPAIARSGPIDVEYEGEFITWQWSDLTPGNREEGSRG